MSNYKQGLSLRNLVVGLETKIPLYNGSSITPVNFDNSATTPPFHSVMKEVNDFAPWYSSVHRGAGYKSIFSTNVYEAGRKVIKNFVNADEDKDEVIYTKNTTESINMLSYMLREKNKKPVILSTFMEHLANDLPWREKFTINYINIDKYGRLRMDDLQKKLEQYNGRVKLVTVAGASNVTGYINSVHDIAKLAHKYGAKILVDGAQMVPHIPVDMKPFDSPEHLDYLVFSAHKMYAPFGVGVLIGPKETFEKAEPVYKGGGDVRMVTQSRIEWDTPPSKDEAGSPNVIGVAALTAAIKTLESVGMSNIEKHENALANYALDRIRQVPDLKVYTNSKNTDRKIGIIPVNINGLQPGIAAKILSVEDGIAVRGGVFCAHLYVERLLNFSKEEQGYDSKHDDIPFTGMVRFSFGLYNNYSEVDRLISALNRIVENKSYYLSKYGNKK